MKKIATVVVTYNRKDLLLENIQSLLAQTARLEMDIIVIDNASTDGTKDSLKKHIDSENVIYLNTGENLGGAGGFQYGIKYAVEHSYDYIWIMDDDTMPTPIALEELLKAIQRIPQDFGFLSSRVEWIDGSLCKMNAQKLNRNRIVEKDIIQCKEATFVSLFIPASVVREVGLPIKEFFIWGDDIEYTRRISEKKKSYYIEKSVVVHKTANNVGSNIAKDSNDRLERYRYAYRNEVYIARHGSKAKKGYQFCKIIYHIFRVLLCAKENRGTRIGIILKASIEGMCFDPQIEFVNKG